MLHFGGAGSWVHDVDQHDVQVHFREHLLLDPGDQGHEAAQLGTLLADYLKSSGLRAVVVASTDLTHYGPNYEFEPMGTGEEALRWVSEVNDPDFIRAVEALEQPRIC